jgi:Arc/MetJ-type ribon-helix-helix transcriptional regulator
MKQGNREKLSVTVDPHVYRVIERHAERARISKSRIVEDAIRLWERSRLAALAREGYQKMSDEDRADAQAYLAVLDEIEE